MKVVRFLFVAGNMLHSTGIDGDLYNGPNAPRGFDENDRNAGAIQIFAYVEGGATVAPQPGTVFVICMDVQTENWGTR
jgi:predicted methyltransferase